MSKRDSGSCATRRRDCTKTFYVAIGELDIAVNVATGTAGRNTSHDGSIPVGFPKSAGDGATAARDISGTCTDDVTACPSSAGINGDGHYLLACVLGNGRRTVCKSRGCTHDAKGESQQNADNLVFLNTHKILQFSNKSTPKHFNLYIPTWILKRDPMIVPILQEQS